MSQDRKTCNHCGRTSEPTIPVRVRVQGKATQYSEAVVPWCKTCRKAHPGTWKASEYPKAGEEE